MSIRIKRVAVLGAGVMGQGIAAHLANAGIASYLFDMAPTELAEGEGEAGLALEDRRVRNRYSAAGIAAMTKAKPALLYRKELADLVTACNYTDDVDKLAECDWIVEVVVERLDIKRQIFEMVEEHRRPGSVISSNTSGLSVAAMAEGRSHDFRRNFMVTHFFNPVRYMRLLEMVPCADTDPAVFAEMAEFGSKVLGKGVVYAKDTPNFIANRVGTFGITSVFHWIGEVGMGIVFAAELGDPARWAAALVALVAYCAAVAVDGVAARFRRLLADRLMYHERALAVPSVGVRFQGDLLVDPSDAPFQPARIDFFGESPGLPDLIRFLFGKWPPRFPGKTLLGF